MTVIYRFIGRRLKTLGTLGWNPVIRDVDVPRGVGFVRVRCMLCHRGAISGDGGIDYYEILGAAHDNPNRYTPLTEQEMSDAHNYLRNRSDIVGYFSDDGKFYPADCFDRALNQILDGTNDNQGGDK